jgi:dihydroneopterin aldolase
MTFRPLRQSTLSIQKWHLTLTDHIPDSLILEVADFDVNVLTGIYSEETKLPQPLRFTIAVEMLAQDHYAPDTPLSASKNYMDLKHAASSALPQGVHFTLIEAVADHVIETLFLQDTRIIRIKLKIIKLAIAENGESIGITLTRSRR